MLNINRNRDKIEIIKFYWVPMTNPTLFKDPGKKTQINPYGIFCIYCKWAKITIIYLLHIRRGYERSAYNFYL